MIAYIQNHRNEFLNINTLSALLGFREKGYEVHCFNFSELPSLELESDTPVAGSIQVVVAALARLGIVAPALPSIPPVLEIYAGRKTWITTMKEARREINRERSIFVKPIPGDRKLFDGKVFRSFKDLITTGFIPEDYPVVCSEPVAFVSEYRIFVMDRDVLGIRHYKGDFRIFPDFPTIDRAIADYHPSPAAYGIDFGVTSDGRTLLVETNEGYALGCYGLAPILYSSLLERRWNELTSPRDACLNQELVQTSTHISN